MYMYQTLTRGPLKNLLEGTVNRELTLLTKRFLSTECKQAMGSFMQKMKTKSARKKAKVKSTQSSSLQANL